MNTDIKKLLNDCGLAKLTNTGVDTLIIKIKKEYNLQKFCTKELAVFLHKYNGLSVDASVAIRKSMKIYKFHGGFQISLKYILDNKETIWGEYEYAVKNSGAQLFPIGNAFDELLCFDEENKVYVGKMMVAKNWEEFLCKLINGEYADL